MQNKLTVVGIQANLVWENALKNRQYFQKIIDTIKTPVDLIVLPEMFTTGFSMHPSKVAETMHGETITWMKTIAKKPTLIQMNSSAGPMHRLWPTASHATRLWPTTLALPSRHAMSPK